MKIERLVLLPLASVMMVQPMVVLSAEGGDGTPLVPRESSGATDIKKALDPSTSGGDASGLSVDAAGAPLASSISTAVPVDTSTVGGEAPSSSAETGPEPVADGGSSASSVDASRGAPSSPPVDSSGSADASTRTSPSSSVVDLSLVTGREASSLPPVDPSGSAPSEAPGPEPVASGDGGASSVDASGGTSSPPPVGLSGSTPASSTTSRHVSLSSSEGDLRIAGAPPSKAMDGSASAPPALSSDQIAELEDCVERYRNMSRDMSKWAATNVSTEAQAWATGGATIVAQEGNVVVLKRTPDSIGGVVTFDVQDEATAAATRREVQMEREGEEAKAGVSPSAGEIEALCPASSGFTIRELDCFKNSRASMLAHGGSKAVFDGQVFYVQDLIISASLISDSDDPDSTIVVLPDSSALTVSVAQSGKSSEDAVYDAAEQAMAARRDMRHVAEEGFKGTGLDRVDFNSPSVVIELMRKFPGKQIYSPDEARAMGALVKLMKTLDRVLDGDPDGDGAALSVLKILQRVSPRGENVDIGDGDTRKEAIQGLRNQISYIIEEYSKSEVVLVGEDLERFLDEKRKIVGNIPFMKEVVDDAMRIANGMNTAQTGLVGDLAIQELTCYLPVSEFVSADDPNAAVIKTAMDEGGKLLQTQFQGLFGAAAVIDTAIGSLDRAEEIIKRQYSDIDDETLRAVLNCYINNASPSDLGNLVQLAAGHGCVEAQRYLARKSLNMSEEEYGIYNKWTGAVGSAVMFGSGFRNLTGTEVIDRLSIKGYSLKRVTDRSEGTIDVHKAVIAAVTHDGSFIPAVAPVVPAASEAPPSPPSSSPHSRSPSTGELSGVADGGAPAAGPTPLDTTGSVAFPPTSPSTSAPPSRPASTADLSGVADGGAPALPTTYEDAKRQTNASLGYRTDIVDGFVAVENDAVPDMGKITQLSLDLSSISSESSVDAEAVLRKLLTHQEIQVLEDGPPASPKHEFTLSEDEWNAANTNVLKKQLLEKKLGLDVGEHGFSVLNILVLKDLKDVTPELRGLVKRALTREFWIEDSEPAANGRNDFIAMLKKLFVFESTLSLTERKSRLKTFTGTDQLPARFDIPKMISRTEDQFVQITKALAVEESLKLEAIERKFGELRAEPLKKYIDEVFLGLEGACRKLGTLSDLSSIRALIDTKLAVKVCSLDSKDEVVAKAKFGFIRFLTDELEKWLDERIRFNIRASDVDMLSDEIGRRSIRARLPINQLGQKTELTTGTLSRATILNKSTQIADAIIDAHWRAGNMNVVTYGSEKVREYEDNLANAIGTVFGDSDTVEIGDVTYSRTEVGYLFRRITLICPDPYAVPSSDDFAYAIRTLLPRFKREFELGSVVSVDLKAWYEEGSESRKQLMSKLNGMTGLSVGLLEQAFPSLLSKLEMGRGTSGVINLGRNLTEYGRKQQELEIGTLQSFVAEKMADLSIETNIGNLQNVLDDSDLHALSSLNYPVVLEREIISSGLDNVTKKIMSAEISIPLSAKGREAFRKRSESLSSVARWQERIDLIRFGIRDAGVIDINGSELVEVLKANAELYSGEEDKVVAALQQSFPFKLDIDSLKGIMMEVPVSKRRFLNSREAIENDLLTKYAESYNVDISTPQRLYEQIAVDRIDEVNREMESILSASPITIDGTSVTIDDICEMLRHDTEGVAYGKITGVTGESNHKAIAEALVSSIRMANDEDSLGKLSEFLTTTLTIDRYRELWNARYEEALKGATTDGSMTPTTIEYLRSLNDVGNFVNAPDKIVIKRGAEDNVAVGDTFDREWEDAIRKDRSIALELIFTPQEVADKFSAERPFMEVSTRKIERVLGTEIVTNIKEAKNAAVRAITAEIQNSAPEGGTMGTREVIGKLFPGDFKESLMEVVGRAYGRRDVVAKRLVETIAKSLDDEDGEFDTIALDNRNGTVEELREQTIGQFRGIIDTQLQDETSTLANGIGNRRLEERLAGYARDTGTIFGAMAFNYNVEGIDLIDAMNEREQVLQAIMESMAPRHAIEAVVSILSRGGINLTIVESGEDSESIATDTPASETAPAPTPELTSGGIHERAVDILETAPEEPNILTEVEIAPDVPEQVEIRVDDTVYKFDPVIKGGYDGLMKTVGEKHGDTEYFRYVWFETSTCILKGMRGGLRVGHEVRNPTMGETIRNLLDTYSEWRIIPIYPPERNYLFVANAMLRASGIDPFDSPNNLEIIPVKHNPQAQDVDRKVEFHNGLVRALFKAINVEHNETKAHNLYHALWDKYTAKGASTMPPPHSSAEPPKAVDTDATASGGGGYYQMAIDKFGEFNLEGSEADTVFGDVLPMLRLRFEGGHIPMRVADLLKMLDMIVSVVPSAFDKERLNENELEAVNLLIQENIKSEDFQDQVPSIEISGSNWNEAWGDVRVMLQASLDKLKSYVKHP
jgi:hypothetical protein